MRSSSPDDGLDLRPVDEPGSARHHGTVTSVPVRRIRLFPIAMWVVALAALAAAVFVWWSFARALHDATPVPAADVPVPDAVVWRGKVYRTRGSLAVALRRSGRTYYVWARNHPGAASLLAQAEAAKSRRSSAFR